jgi:hypothetical protein
MHSVPIDGGLATCITTLGVFGFSTFLVHYKAKREDHTFEMFVCEAASAIRDDAFVLRQLCSASSWERTAQAKALLLQVRRLSRSVKTFQKGSPYTRIKRYSARIRIDVLEEEVSRHFVMLQNESVILEKHPTDGVVEVAHSKLGWAAGEIEKNCTEVCAVLGFSKPLPTSRDIQKIFESAQI